MLGTNQELFPDAALVLDTASVEALSFTPSFIGFGLNWTPDLIGANFVLHLLDGEIGRAHV